MSDFPVPPSFGAGGPPPPPPAAPEPGREPRRARVVVFAVSGVVLAALVALAAWALGPDDDDETAAPSSTPTTSTPDTTPDTTAPDTTTPDTTEAPTTTEGGGDPAFEAMIDGLIAFVEQERGLEFLERPDVVVLPPDEFVATYQRTIEEDFAEQAEEVEHYSGIYQALGILPEGVTLEEAYNAFGAAGVGGFYDPETDELFVRGGDITPLVRIIIAHELVHALDDQHFDLDRPEYDDRDDEIGFGFSAVLEGNARFIENRFRASLSGEETAEARAEELSMGIDVDFSKFTPTFIELQLLPYEAGEVLVGILLDDGGRGALDAAITDPPTTSEQVLLPDRFASGEVAAAVPPPPADGELEEDGIFGMAVFRVLLAQVLGDSDAENVVDGWAGDWFVSWTADERTCIRVDVLLDSSDAADDFEDALAEWAGRRDDVERLDDATVRLTACE